MSGALLNIKVDESGFSQSINDFAAVAMMNTSEAFAYQTGLLFGELIKRTPPFTGQRLAKMIQPGQQAADLAKAGSVMGPFVPKGFKDEGVEDMSALAIGKRRVEKDIRKVIYGLTGATLSERQLSVSKGSGPGATDWGVLQKCEGKQAVRLFATKKGEVFGADLSEFKPNASLEDLKAHHDSTRGKRGRTTSAATGDRRIGRWVWLNVVATQERALAQFIKWKQEYVGQGKGGWAEGFMAMGGRMSRRGWVGKHARSAGSVEAIFKPGNVHVKIINKSRWASGGDPDRIIAQSMEGRAKAIAGDIRRRLEKIWGSKARRRAA